MMRRAARGVVAAYATILTIASVQLGVGMGQRTDVVRSAAPYALALLVFLGAHRWAARTASTASTASGSLRARRAVAALAVAGSLLSAWLVVRFVGAAAAYATADSSYYRIKVHVTSPLGDHNTAGGLLLVAVVAAVVLAAEDARWWIAVLCTTVGVVATMSRGAAVMLAVAAVTSWWMASGRSVAIRLTASALSVAIGVFGLALVLDASPPPGAEVPESGLGASLLGRVDLAWRGAQVAAADPWLGSGLGSFREQAADLPIPNHHAHQQVVHAAAEAGFVGGLAVLFLVAVLVVLSARLPRSPLRDAALLGGGAMIGHAQLDILGGLVAYEATVAFLLGLVLAAHGRRERDPTTGRLAGSADPP